MNRRIASLLPLVAFGLLTDATAQRLLIPDSTADTVMEFDPVTGAILNPAFIDLAALTGGLSITPIEVIEVANGELWVSDQLADVVFRFSADGSTYLGASTAVLDNMRGLHPLGAGALVANSGSANGAPGDALVQLDGAGATVTSVAASDPFDVVPYTFNGVGGFLFSDIANEDIVFADGANLANQTIFHDSDGVTGIDFPEQVSVTPSGDVLAGGFTAPSGIYRYDSLGNEVAYIDTPAIGGQSGIRGVFELGNGNILFTNGGGVHVYDTTAGTITSVITGVGGRFISLIGGSACICNNYCSNNPNSTGAGGSISAMGSSSVADNDVTLSASSLPQNAFGFFITSQTQGFVANPNGSQGNLCVLGSIGRYVGTGQIQNSSAVGSFSLVLDLTQTPQPNAFVSIAAGETWNFQAWHRDSVMGMSTSNFTDGISITFN